MADEKTLRDDKPTITPHPADTFAAVCCDVIDLGLTVEEYEGKTSLKDKVAIGFRTEAVQDNGQPHHIYREFTATFGPKANLRKFLEAWRGKAYTDDEAKKQGIPLHKLVGHPALVSIAHKVSRAGNTYAIISSIMPLPKAMRDGVPTLDGYERGEWWAKKKLEYEAKAKAFLAARDAHELAGAEPLVDDEDDGLPW